MVGLGSLVLIGGTDHGQDQCLSALPSGNAS
jgi:hypothetical protein